MRIFWAPLNLNVCKVMTGKHLCRGLFLHNTAGWSPATIFKWDSNTSFSVKSGKFLNLWISKHSSQLYPSQGFCIIQIYYVSSRFSPLCYDYCALFPTLGFILLFFIENHPSHNDIGVGLKLLQSCIQNPLKHLRWCFLLRVVNWFHKKLHRKYLTGLRIRISIGTIFYRKRSWEIPHGQFSILFLYQENILLSY